MRRITLYVILGILTAAAFATQQTPHTNQDDLLFEDAQFWARVFDMPYGLDFESNKTAIPLAGDVVMQWEEHEDWAGLVIVGITGTNPPPKQCSVSCAAGNFACCWINDRGWPRCRCLPNAESDGHCTGGGHHARDCGITRGGDIEAGQ